MAGCLILVGGVELEHHLQGGGRYDERKLSGLTTYLPDLGLDVSRVVVFGVRPDEVHGVVVEVLLGLHSTVLLVALRSLSIHTEDGRVDFGPLLVRHCWDQSSDTAS